MKVFHFLTLVFVAVFLVSCSEQAPDQQNVVIFFVDDLGWRELACYGNDLNETPNVDALAENGLLFTQAYATAPVCSPSRASMLTGKYPARLKITDWIPGHQAGRGAKNSEKFLVSDFKNELPLEEITLAEILKSHGYRTASIGKWHLGGEGFSPTEQGFDINIGGNHKGQPPSYYHPYTRVFDDGSMLNIPFLDTLPAESYLTDRLTSEVLKFISSSAEVPFFLYFPFFTVHTPIQGREDLVHYYRDKLASRNDSVTFNPEYSAMVHCMDENIGRVVKLLDSLNLTDHTLIVFASDNGGLYVENEQRFNLAAYNYPLREGKGYVYEGGIRVSTIFSGSWVRNKGRKSDKLMASIDIMPTILDYLGIENPHEDMDGISLLPILKGKANEIKRETLFWHYPHYHRGMPASVVRKGNYKLIEFLEDGKLELYNLLEDVGEERNLIDSEAAIAKEMLDELHQWKIDISAYQPALNPNYLPD